MRAGVVVAVIGAVVLYAACSGSSPEQAGADASAVIPPDAALARPDGGDTAIPDWAAIPTSAFPFGGNAYVRDRDGGVAANLSCLGTADTDPTTALSSLDFSGNVRDFETNGPMPGVEVAVWTDLAELANAPAASTLSADAGTYAISVPATAGKKRLHWRTREPRDAFDTWELAQRFDVALAAQTADRNTVSQTTGRLLPALAGVTWRNGTASVGGEVRDCDRAFVGNAIATVVGADDKPVPGIKVIYTDDTGAPKKRNPADPASMATNPKDGLFLIINVPPAPTGLRLAVDANIQGVRTRIGEFAMPTFADSVEMTRVEPKRTP